MCQSKTSSTICDITVKEIDGEQVAYCENHSSSLMAGRLYASSTEENYTPTLSTQTYTTYGLREPDTVSSYDGNTTYLGQLNGILGTSYSTANDFKTDLQDEYNEIVCYNEEDFEFPFTSGEFFTESMTRYCGCVARIEDIEIGRYKLDVDGNQNFWTDDMIERLVESASVREFRLPPDDDDKLATEVRKGGVRRHQRTHREERKGVFGIKILYTMKCRGIPCGCPIIYTQTNAVISSRARNLRDI